MTFTMGRAADTFTLYLTTDADFIDALIRKDGEDWALTVVATLTFPTDPITEWVGTLNGERIEWNVDVVDVAEVIAARPKKVKLWYVNDDIRLLWAAGVVSYK